MKLLAGTETTPSGDIHLVLMYNNQRIGTCKAVGDGYLTLGKRNPVKTLEDAALQCLETSMRRHENDVRKTRAMWKQIKAAKESQK